MSKIDKVKKVELVKEEVTPEVVEKITDVPQSIEVTIEAPKIEPQVQQITKYFKCPFCGEKDTKTRNGSDPTSSWCTKCGRCFEVKWVTE
jgi:transposase-like protein